MRIGPLLRVGSDVAECFDYSWPTENHNVRVASEFSRIRFPPVGAARVIGLLWIAIEPERGIEPADSSSSEATLLVDGIVALFGAGVRLLEDAAGQDGATNDALE